MSFNIKFLAALAVSATLTLSSIAQATVIPVVEDVMTSGFFSVAPNFVRGYVGDGRAVHRVSTDGAFSTSGAETVHLTFDAANFSGFTSPVASAILTMESASGGFGADASSGSPFTVSAHAVDADPVTSITDDTNLGGTISWLDFFNNNILAADPAAHTVIDGFGTVTFDVTAVVNDWISGANTVFALAMTGKNDTSGNDFLHGFVNNSETPGSTFLTVTAVPEPASLALMLLGFVGVSTMRRRS